MRHARRELAHRAKGLAAHELRLGRLQVLHDALEALGGLLRFLEQAGVLDGVADVGQQRVQELQVDRAERRGRRGALRLLLGQVDHADDPIRDPDRHADEGAGAVLGGVRAREAGIARDVLDQDRLAVGGDLSRDAFAEPRLRAGGELLRDPPGHGHPEHLAVRNVVGYAQVAVGRRRVDHGRG